MAAVSFASDSYFTIAGTVAYVIKEVFLVLIFHLLYCLTAKHCWKWDTVELCCRVTIDSGILATIFPSGVAYSVKVHQP